MLINKKYTSRITKFYNLDLWDKHKILCFKTHTSRCNISRFLSKKGLKIKTANFMIENNIGVFGLPIGIVLNFIVNNKPVIIPLVTEEPSIIAACSLVGYIVGKSGGFYTKSTSPIMIGQMHITGIKNIHMAKIKIQTNQLLIINIINKICINMVRRGGGCINIGTQILYPRKNSIHNQYDTNKQIFLIYFYINCCEAMGANVVNTVLESITIVIKELLSCNTGIRIISNLSTRRMTKAYCKIPYHLLDKNLHNDSGFNIAINIINAYRVAIRDPYRACTHNKGIMNGIDALAIATGNDWRSIEANAHTYASREGHYTSLTMYRMTKNNLQCFIELPLAVGVVGGSIKSHPLVYVIHKILGKFSCHAKDLAGLMAAVGLSQNLAALKALVSEGIQKGHMFLHARQISLSAGANKTEVKKLTYHLIKNNQINFTSAKILLKNMRKNN